MWAAEDGNAEALQLLIKKGARTDLRDKVYKLCFLFKFANRHLVTAFTWFLDLLFVQTCCVRNLALRRRFQER